MIDKDIQNESMTETVYNYLIAVEKDDKVHTDVVPFTKRMDFEDFHELRDSFEKDTEVTSYEIAFLGISTWLKEPVRMFSLGDFKNTLVKEDETDDTETNTAEV